MWREYRSVLEAAMVDQAHALYTDADMMFTGDVSPAIK